MKSAGKIILIAEDHADSRFMLRTFLEDLGYQVFEAQNGRQTIEQASSVRPDLILIDLIMPELDGISAIRYIRSQPELMEIPIIANSADGRRGIDLFSSTKNLGRGYLEYVAKPFDLRLLIEQIETALGSVRDPASD